MAVIPFSFLPPKVVFSLSNHVMGIARKVSRSFPTLQIELERVDFNIKADRYIAMSLIATSFMFIFLSIVMTIFLLKLGNPLFGVVIGAASAMMIFFIQLNYPKVTAHKRVRELDTNLLDALRAIMIHLNSGVPLFECLVIVSNQQLGEVSKVFKNVVHEINAGVPQVQALENMALSNPSLYFRRAIWQIINGMKQGATITPVITSVVNNLTREQVIQIEKYGSQLSPLAMFYMMGAVVMPALGITFIIVISSFISLEAFLVKTILWGLLGFVTFMQIMFSGTIKTKRPSLLGE